MIRCVTCIAHTKKFISDYNEMLTTQVLFSLPFGKNPLYKMS